MEPVRAEPVDGQRRQHRIHRGVSLLCVLLCVCVFGMEGANRLTDAQVLSLPGGGNMCVRIKLLLVFPVIVGLVGSRDGRASTRIRKAVPLSSWRFSRRKATKRLAHRGVAKLGHERRLERGNRKKVGSCLLIILW